MNFSARTVISPDPNLSVIQVGIPLAIANEMSIPVQVTPYNIEELKEMVQKRSHQTDTLHALRCKLRDQAGQAASPACGEQPRDDCSSMIEPGWTVERQIRDGDIVLFNRQPSLHRMSIMAHRVKVMDGRTFRLNPAVCPPYNADFDGDEMNLHIPQTEEARAEAAILVAVQENILSPRFGGPIIGGIHDHISGIFMLTNQVRWFTKEETLYLLKNIGVEHLPTPGKGRGWCPVLDQQAGLLRHPSCRTQHGLQGKFLPELRYLCEGTDCERDAYVRIIDGQARVRHHRQEGDRGV